MPISPWLPTAHGAALLANDRGTPDSQRDRDTLRRWASLLHEQFPTFTISRRSSL